MMVFSGFRVFNFDHNGYGGHVVSGLPIVVTKDHKNFTFSIEVEDGSLIGSDESET